MVTVGLSTWVALGIDHECASYTNIEESVVIGIHVTPRSSVGSIEQMGVLMYPEGFRKNYRRGSATKICGNPDLIGLR